MAPPSTPTCPTCGLEVSPLASNCPYDGTELDPDGLGYTLVKTALPLPVRARSDAPRPLGRAAAARSYPTWRDEPDEHSESTQTSVTLTAIDGRTQVANAEEEEAEAADQTVQNVHALVDTRPTRPGVEPQGAAGRVDRAAETPAPEDTQPRYPREAPAPAAERVTENAHDPLIGAHLGEYWVQSRIGAGGMGIVYKAVQPVIGRPVAIKVLKPELASDPEQVQRLLSEARAVNAIRHRGIIDVVGFGRFRNQQYMVMEYLEGRGLEVLIAERAPLPVPRALDIFDEVLAALEAAHIAGFIHRDLKPSNIFLAEQAGGGQFVKLLDFGLAKQGTPRTLTAQTRINTMVGTPDYMAPEQARGQPIGPTADLYAAGVVLFEMLTGQLPFEAASAMEMVMRHIEHPPPLPSSRNPAVPPVLDALVMTLLQKDPNLRPRSAEDARAQLEDLRRTPGAMDLAAAASVIVNESALSAPRAPKDAPTLDRTSRSRLGLPVRLSPLLVGTAVGVLLMGGALALLPQNDSPADKHDRTYIAPRTASPAPLPGELRRSLSERLDTLRLRAPDDPAVRAELSALQAELKDLDLSRLPAFSERLDTLEARHPAPVP